MNDPGVIEGLEGIAIIAMTCRFPGANNTSEFWGNLRDGIETISFFSDDELLSSGISPEVLANRSYIKAKGSIENSEMFDAALFGFSPIEAEIVDPQHRLFMECAWEVLELAGYNCADGQQRIGVYAGVGQNTYLYNLIQNRELQKSVSAMQILIGNDKDYVSTHTSYKLNLKGPSVTVQTACSTSLVAVHLACQSLLSGECDMALAGGATIAFPQKNGYLFMEGGIFSPDGHCRAFDEKARGTVSGNGVGVVVLKHLANAIADGDSILAVIKGSAINNDGALKVGFTAPGVDGQAEVIAEAIAMAGVEPETISYIESHGTGTEIGDQIEMAALTQVFRARSNKKKFCAIGSTKSFIGHLDTAAGVASLIKTVLALKHRMIPPSLHVTSPNPKIDFDNSPFYVNTTLAEWKAGATPRRAGVSSFGIGGTNAHVVLEEAPPVGPSGPSRQWQLLTILAKTPTALNAATTDLANYLKENPGVNLGDVAYSLHVGRRPLALRRMIVCEDSVGAALALERGDFQDAPASVQEGSDRHVAFLFPGVGTQYVNMGLSLYESEPAFREQVDLCSDLLKGKIGGDLRKFLYPPPDQWDESTARLNDTTIAMPALFTIEYALAKLWMSWGIQPQAMIGHSLGEYVAACLAGVFSLEGALSLVVIRSQLLKRLPEGTMLSIPLPETEVRSLIGHDLSVAAVNAPSQCVVSGPVDAVSQFANRLSKKGVEHKRLRVDVAAHSDMVSRVADLFSDEVKKLKLAPPALAYVSNVTGDWITPQEATDPSYWARHLRQTVRFVDGVEKLLERPNLLLLEVGPGKTLSSLVKLNRNGGNEPVALPSMRHPQDSRSDVAFILNTLGSLWLAGVRIDWGKFHAHERRHRIPLPPYPFERKRYWVERLKQKLAPVVTSAPLEKRTEVANWFYIPSWKRTVPPTFAGAGSLIEQDSGWLIFTDEFGIGSALARRLREENQLIYTVSHGDEFEITDALECSLRAGEPGDYDALIEKIGAGKLTRLKVAYLWNMTRPDGQLDAPAFRRHQDIGFYSLLYLAQALAKYCGEQAVDIQVISNNLHRVAGEAEVDSRKATVLGLCKVIAREYPSMTCRSIDFALPPSSDLQSSRIVERLLAEVSAHSDDPVIAYRGCDRWVQTSEPAPLPATGRGSSPIKRNGVYLITGGLDGVGYEIAKHLARDYQAKLAVVELANSSGTAEANGLRLEGPMSEVENSDIPPMPRSQAIELDFEEESRLINQVEEEIQTGGRIKTIKQHEGFEETVNRLCSSYALDYLATSKMDLSGSCESDELRKLLKILPRFDRFYDLLIDMLSEDGVIKTNNGKVEFLKSREEVGDPIKLKEEIAQRYPEFKGLLRLLDHCAKSYPAALKGEIDVLGVLYPEGSSDFLNASAHSTLKYSDSDIYLRLARETVLKAIKRSRGRRLRILEVGGGLGAFTRLIAFDLKGENVEYHFTDLGKAFVINAEREASKYGLDFMKFGSLDISKDPTAQGYDEQSFDIIVAYNVVHATRSIEATTTNLKNLLAPGGLLLLVEMVKSYRWNAMIWGLTDGWWCFEDRHLRSQSPLLDLTTWEEVLSKVGFGKVKAYPLGQRRSDSEHGLIMAQTAIGPLTVKETSKDSAVSGEADPVLIERMSKVRALNALGAEVAIFDARLDEPDDVRLAVSKATESFGAINGVIHAVGLKTEGAIRSLTREEAKRQIEPKALGALALHDALRDTDLDFLAFFSSLSSVSGEAGFAAYCAADAFLDSFTDRIIAMEGKPAISINWDEWLVEQRKVGEENSFEGPAHEDKAKTLITATEGLDALNRILSANVAPRVIVSPRELERLLQSRETAEARPTPAPDPSAEPVKIRYPRPMLAQAYVSARTEVEEILAGIWQDLLGIVQIGVDDNFYDLGGDSLIALQVMSRVREIFSITIPARSLIDSATVATLAEQIERLIESKPATGREQETLPDAVPFTPAQLRFLENNPIETMQWINNLTAEFRQPADPEMIRRSIDEVVAYHDVLRLCYKRNGSGWSQHYAADNSGLFSLVDLSGLSQTEQDQAIEAKKAEINASLNLSEGPIRTVFFTLGGTRPDRLVAYVHHAVMDGVSLHILQEDLETAYRQLLRGETVRLPGGQRFHFAAERLQEFASSDAVGEELQYWTTALSSKVARIPTDYQGANVWESIGSINVSLSPDETRSLLEKLRPLGARMNEVLLLSLYNAISNWQASPAVLLELTAHGRGDFLPGVDLSRIIGYFLSYFPVLFNLEGIQSPETALKAVQEKLQQVPNGGVGYNLLRYGSKLAGASERLSRLPQSEISFNYLGHLDQTFHESSLFKLSNEQIRSPWAPRRYAFDVIAQVSSGRLQMAWLYSQNLHKRSTVEALARSTMTALRSDFLRG